jgi:hypothetical protein
MPLRDEKTFTDDEMIAAFGILLPPERAREEALAFNALPDLHGLSDSTAPDELVQFTARGPRSYDGDILDLLSMVSESCARRAWMLLGLTFEEGAQRRESFRRRVEQALRIREQNDNEATS